MSQNFKPVTVGISGGSASGKTTLMSNRMSGCRLLRDVTQRGGDLEGAVAWYRRDVIPNFPVYTEPCKGYADLVVPFLDENPVALQTLVAGLRDRIVNQRASVKLEM